MPAPIDLTGRRFGRLTVIGLGPEYVSENGYRTRRWHCACDCGKLTLTYGNGLKAGKANSCGCLRGEKKTLKHGMSNIPEYGVWQAMKTRCLYEKSSEYHNYGGRGITVCDSWIASFEAFYADMGPRPPGLWIERRDNNGNYEPSNCYWATPTEQLRNRRVTVFITFNGETKTQSEWAMQLNTSSTTIRERWKRFGTLLPPTEWTVRRRSPARQSNTRKPK